MNILASAITYCDSHLGTPEYIHIEQKLIFIVTSIIILKQEREKKIRRYYLIIDLTTLNSKPNCFTDFRAWTYL